MRARQINTAYLRLFILALIWSASFLLIKISVGSIGPATLAALRLCIAAAVLGGWLALQRRGLPLHKRALLLYSVVGVPGNALPFALIGWGELHISSAQAAILMGVMPVATFLLAHWFLPSEPMRYVRALGIGLGFCGLFVLVGGSALDGLDGHALGQIAVFAAAICYGGTSVFVRAQPAFQPMQMATGALIAGALVSVPAAFWLEDPTAMTPTVAALWSALALGVVSTAAAMLLYFRVIGALGAVAFSQLNYLVPVLGGLWGVWLLGETLQLRAFIALALVLIGVYLVRPRAYEV